MSRGQQHGWTGALALLLAAAVPCLAAAPATQPAAGPAATQPAATQPATTQPAATRPAEAKPPRPDKAERQAKRKAEREAREKADAGAKAAAEEKAAADAARRAAEATTVSFDTDRAVVWLDGTQVIPFRVDAPAEVDRTLPASVKPADGGDGAGVTVVRKPTVLAGQTLGFLRVRAEREGAATLTVGHGGRAAELYIDARPSPAAAEMRTVSPTISSPADGAVIWGEIGVSIELFATAASGEAPTVRLRLPDGGTYDPIPTNEPQEGPRYRFGFTFDADAYPPGPVDLTPELVADDGSVTPGPAVTLYVHRPAAAELLTGEAEDRADAERPERFRDQKDPADPVKPLNLADDPDASGGRFVVNSGARPPLVLRVDRDRPGWYQVMMTARGDASNSVLPTVGLHLANENDPETASAVASTSWHRAPIGRPIYLKSGPQDVVVLFENDESTGKGQDRNLALDRYEVARLPDAVGRAAARRGGLTVTLDPSLDGSRVSGELFVSGRARLAAKGANPPAVRLLINGEVRLSQTTLQPGFNVGRADLNAGENTLQLIAEDADGHRAASAVHTVTLLGHPAATPPRWRVLRYYAADAAWTADGKADLTPLKQAGDDPVRRFLSNGSVSLSLPDGLAGEFEVELDAWGEKFDGPPVAAVTLVAGDERKAVGEVEAGGDGFTGHRVGTVVLPAGPKSLEVAFINDAYDAAKKKDRNLYVRRLKLTETAPADTVGPAAVIQYPARRAGGPRRRRGRRRR